VIIYIETLNIKNKFERFLKFYSLSLEEIINLILVILNLKQFLN